MGKSKILIVDDNQENLSVIGNLLLNNNYNVLIAQSGVQALQLVEHKIPDLILLDISMPGLSGFDVCMKLKEDPNFKNIPVIFLTARSESEDIVKGFKLGAVDYVTKPFNSEELLSRVSTHIELITAKRELEHKNQELTETIATKDKLFSIISHDLKGPIGAMMNVADILSEDNDVDTETVRSFFKTQKEITHNTYYLLDNLLRWARLNNEQISHKPSMVILELIIEECISGVAYQAELKKIHIQTKNTNKIKYVFADGDMLRVIIRNLLSNAIKYTPVKGAIKIMIETHDNIASISIIDSGIGMTPEDTQKICSDTTYYTKPGTNNEKGTGLGLQLVRSFVEQNKGKLTIDSEPGKGSKFTFTIPLNEEK